MSDLSGRLATFDTMLDISANRLEIVDPDYFAIRPALELEAYHQLRELTSKLGSLTLHRLTGAANHKQLTAVRAMLSFGYDNGEGELRCIAWPRSEASPPDAYHNEIAEEFIQIAGDANFVGAHPDSIPGLIIRGPNRQAFIGGTYDLPDPHKLAIASSARATPSVGYSIIDWDDPTANFTLAGQDISR